MKLLFINYFIFLLYFFLQLYFFYINKKNKFNLFFINKNVFKQYNIKYKYYKKFHLKNEENNINNKNNLHNHNIFRNKYNTIPSIEDIKIDIQNFKKQNSHYFTEHSILEVINIENNIIVLNIEGKFFEDINIVFAEITKYLLNKHLSILGIHPHNLNSLNIKEIT